MIKLKKLELENFGPFEKFYLDFIEDDRGIILLTGKNNAGKSNIIKALKLVSDGLKVINNKKQKIFINSEVFYRLLQQDVKEINIGRQIYNYRVDVAKISAQFTNFKLNVYLDAKNNDIYCDCEGMSQKTEFLKYFGFFPAFGPISEVEYVISDLNHLRYSLDTTLAPRHLRNHLYSSLTEEDFNKIKEIIANTWKDIELLKYEINSEDNSIVCFYKERNITREIAWAGQGLQIWFQIVTHLVRLQNCSMLILDEPEVNLHPEQQNILINLLREYFNGIIIIATHSVEIMNNVRAGHIINIVRDRNHPTLRSTNDRVFLNTIRSEIGSSFNLIASQFEEYELLIFTEDVYDFYIIDKLSKKFNIQKKFLIYQFMVSKNIVSVFHIRKLTKQL